MNAVRLIPVYFSFLLLSAHFYRSYMYPLVIICLVLPFILFIQKAWVARIMQLSLLIGAIEWIRAAYFIALERQQAGEPTTRLYIILGSVALFTGLSALLFQMKSLKSRYGLNQPQI